VLLVRTRERKKKKTYSIPRGAGDRKSLRQGEEHPIRFMTAVGQTASVRKQEIN